MEKVAPASQSAVRELDSRTNDGITVTLLWQSTRHEVWIHVVDARGEIPEYLKTIDAKDAHEAFEHPARFVPQLAA